MIVRSPRERHADMGRHLTPGIQVCRELELQYRHYNLIKSKIETGSHFMPGGPIILTPRLKTRHHKK